MRQNNTWGRNWGGHQKQRKPLPKPIKSQSTNQYFKNEIKNSETIDRNINISEFRSFIIIVNKRKYECNIFGVNSSNVIRQFRQENPDANQYEYNYENQNNEFQLICDIFNFRNITITTKNMDALLQMSEDLQIDLVTDKINKFVDTYESKIQNLEDYTSIFNSLYQIRTITAETVRNSIINSEWIKTEEKIQELAAIILQVSRTNFYIHSYLIDLLILLEQSSEETNKISLLIPFLINKLKHEFCKNKFYCSFIYRMTTKKLISINDILESIQNTSSAVFWFFPELIEIKNYSFDRILDLVSNEDDKEFIQKFLPDKIDQFKKIRENGEPENELEKSILYDDIDTFKQIVAKNQIKIEGSIKTTKLFDAFDKIQKSYINYAAECGSIKCFKYLLLNHANINNLTYGFAVYGGNTEIVRITDQQNKNQNVINTNDLFSYSIDQIKSQSDVLESIKIIDYFNNSKNCCFDNKSLLCPIILTIKMHKYDLFDWIFEKNRITIEKSNDIMLYLAVIAAQSGNCHALIHLIDNGFDLKINNHFCGLISIASSLGFYKFANFVFSLNDRLYTINNLSQSIPFIFGSLSIFKLFFNGLQNDTSISFHTSLLKYLIKMEYLSIINYIFEELTDQNNNSMLEFFIVQSVSNNSIKVFNFLISKFNFDLLSNKYNFTYEKFINLTMLASQNGNFEVFKKITDFLISTKQKLNYTNQIIAADFANQEEIFKYILENKILCNLTSMLDKCRSSIPNILKIKLKIIASLPSNEQYFYLPFYLNEAILKGISDFDENLIKKEFLDNTILMNSIKSDNVEIVKKVLKCNSEPSFINQINENGTILNIAVCNNNLSIVQFLLSIPGIDPSLTNQKGETPLITAIENHNIEIIDSILDFYGDQIRTQIWQIEKSFGKLITKKDQSSSQNKSTWGKWGKQKAYSSYIQNPKKEKEINIKDVFYHIINRLSKYKNINLDIHSSNQTFLTYACNNNDLKFVELLLQFENIDVNLTDSMGDSPLIISIKNKNFEISKLLIEHPKTNINYKNSSCQTALIIAVENKFEEIIPIILNDNKFDPIESELNFAFNISTGQISKLLFTKDLEINCKFYKRKVRFDNLLMNAIEQKDPNKIEMIITHPSFNPIESHSNIALKSHFFNDNIELFDKLYNITKNYIDSCTSMDIYSLLLICSDIKYEEKMFEIIKREDFNPDINCFYNSFVNLFTTFLANKQNASIQLIKEFVEFDECHNHFIDLTQNLLNGESFYNLINPNLKNVDEIVQFLLDNNVNPNLPGNYGVYPLEYAILTKSYPFVSTLLNSGKIDFSIALKGGQTYFDIALSCVEKNILNEFYEKELNKSNINTPDFLNFNKKEIFEQYKSSPLFNNKDVDLDLIQQIILITEETSSPITMEIILKNSEKIEKVFSTFKINSKDNDTFMKIKEIISILYIELGIGNDVSSELKNTFIETLIQDEKVHWDIIKYVVLFTNRTKFPITFKNIGSNISELGKMLTSYQCNMYHPINFIFAQIMRFAPLFYNKINNIKKNSNELNKKANNDYIKVKIKQNQQEIEDKSKGSFNSDHAQNNDNNNNNNSYE